MARVGKLNQIKTKPYFYSKNTNKNIVIVDCFNVHICMLVKI